MFSKNITYLSLQQREQATTPNGLSVEGGSKVVRVVAAGGDICHPQKSTEGILVLSQYTLHIKTAL